MAGFRRTGGRSLDREHEHRAGRQQEALPHFRGDHPARAHDEPDLRTYGFGGFVMIHSLSNKSLCEK